MTDQTQQPTPEQAARAKVLLRIKKMLAMADDKRGNPAEIATAAEQAATLMRKYNIEYAEAIAADVRRGVDIIEADLVDSNYIKHVPHWYNTLGWAVAQSLDCQARLVWVKRDRKHYLTMRLYGYKPDIEVSQWLFGYLVGQVQQLADAQWKPYMARLQFEGKPIYPNTRRKWKDQYREGLVAVLNGRIREVYGKAAAAEAEAARAAGSTALVVLKEQAIKGAFETVEFEYATLKSSASSRPAYWMGSADAAKVKVQRVIEEDAKDGADEELPEPLKLEVTDGSDD